MKVNYDAIRSQSTQSVHKELYRYDQLDSEQQSPLPMPSMVRG